MRKKFVLVFGMFFLMAIVLFGFDFLSAQEVSFCCERLKSGPWCQNAPKSECATSEELKSSPTSCESTGYCKLGTCSNVREGTCLPNTPKVVCENEGGQWYDSPRDEVPQCRLGCCLIGDQAAFVTQSRCLKMSSDYELKTNFRTDIQSEVECIASATPEAKGACVFEGEFDRDCKFMKKSECQEIEGEFHQNLLCSNPVLNVNCGPSKQTTCLEDRDEVYFLDSCGNLANVYDADKVNDQKYWDEITAPDCDVTDYAKCGNCNYFRGSTCVSEKDADGRKAEVGDNVCRSLECNYNENTYQHGETWCGVPTDDDLTKNPGGRHFRFICYDGEVSIEPCAEYRQEVCIGNHANEEVAFKNAACRVNRWRDCYSQDNKEACEDTDIRDCEWLEGVSVLRDENVGLGLVVDEIGKLVPREIVIDEGSGKIEEGGGGVEATCVPEHPPGFDFWNEGDAIETCQIANTHCVVKYKKGLFGGDDAWEVDKERTVILCLNEKGELEEGWAKEFENLCLNLGDCGISPNYIGQEGGHKRNDLFETLGKLGSSDEEEEGNEE